MQMFAKKRISIIVENTYRDKIIRLLEEAGTTGFTVYRNIYGKGRHGIKGDYGGLSEFSANVEIVTITSPEVAERVLRGLQKTIEKDIVLIVHVIDVSVLRNDHF